MSGEIGSAREFCIACPAGHAFRGGVVMSRAVLSQSGSRRENFLTLEALVAVDARLSCAIYFVPV